MKINKGTHEKNQKQSYNRFNINMGPFVMQMQVGQYRCENGYVLKKKDVKVIC